MSEKDVDIFTWMYDNKNIPTAMRDELVNYLKQAKKIRDKAARANEKRLKQQQAKEAEQAARLSVLHENEDMNKKRKPLQTPPSGTSSNNNTPSTNASSRRRKKGGNKNKKKKKQRGGKKKQKHTPTPNEIELSKLTEEYTAMQGKIKEDICSLLAMKEEVASLQNEINNNNKENDNNNDNTETTDDTPTAAPTADTESINNALPIYYNLNGGRAGSINLNNTILGQGIILADDLVDGLEPLPAEINNKDAAKTRRKKKWKVSRYGAAQVVHPKGTHLVTTRELNKYKKNSKIIKKLEDLFSGEQSSWSRTAMMIMTAGGLHNYGGSDEAFEIMISMVFKALFYEIDFKISHIQLARGCPSRRTIARYELYFAADCLMKVIYEIKSDGAKELGIIFDHGERGGQDHFVVVIVWTGVNKETKRRTFKRFCPSIDSAGHKTEEAAAAIKLVIDRTLGDNVNVTVTAATGDSGGGGSIQNMTPKMKENGVLAKDGNTANCVSHGLQKSFENSCTLTMGAPGNGKRCPDQLTYAFSIMCSCVRKKGGIILLDTLWDIVTKEMQTNPHWKKLAEETMCLPWEEVMSVVQALTEPDPEGEQTMSNFFFKAPRGIQEPVWSRWQSVSCCNIILINAL